MGGVKKRNSKVTKRNMIVAVALITATAGMASELWIGAAEADITPDRPVALDGNTTGPISKSVKSAIKAAVLALETRCDSQKVVWECEAGLGYEIAPSPVTQKGDLLFVPTTSGVIYAIDRKENRVVWKYQAGEALINHILPVGGRRLLVTTFDGKVVCLRY